MNPLVDTYNRKHTYLRISVTDRCNLQCHYCMPPQGIQLKERDEILRYDEIERVAKIFANMGVNKIRLTGGEPLVRKNLHMLVQQLASIPEIQTLGMTTNGVLLKSNVYQLKQAGLTQLNVSLDTLHPSRFEMISGRQYFNEVIGGIYASIDAGFQPLKLNVVVMGGINDDELINFLDFVKDKPINLRFIEYMPFKFNRWNKAGFVSYQQMLEMISEQYEIKPLKRLENSVAKDYWINGLKEKVSFITSMSDHFCGGCNRVRLTADGSIKSCLFHPAEVNLRSALRDGSSDETISGLIKAAINAKPFGHPEAEELVKIENRSMIQIGG